MKKSRNKIRAKLNKEENEEIRRYVLTGKALNGEINLKQTALLAIDAAITKLIRELAFKYRCNLNKDYKITGEYPNYELEMVKKKPFTKKKNDK